MPWAHLLIVLYVAGATMMASDGRDLGSPAQAGGFLGLCQQLVGSAAVLLRFAAARLC